MEYNIIIHITFWMRSFRFEHKKSEPDQKGYPFNARTQHKNRTMTVHFDNAIELLQSFSFCMRSRNSGSFYYHIYLAIEHLE